MDIEDKIKMWIDQFSLEEVLEYNDLSPERAVFLLWKAGHIELPDWIEEELEEYDVEEDEDTLLLQ